MSKFNTLFLLFFYAVTSAAFFGGGSETTIPTGSYQRLEGTLYAGRIEVLDKADVPIPTARPHLPIIPVYVMNLKALGLDNGTSEFIGQVVSESKAKARVVPGPMEQKSFGNRTVSSKEIYGKISTAPPSPKRLQPSPQDTEDSFKTLDTILSGTGVAFPLAARFKVGDVAFQLHSLAKYEEHYLLKYSVTNEEDREFFISSLDVLAGNSRIETRFYMPFSCRSNEEVFGIAKFPVAAVSAKKVSLNLQESGGKNRRIQIKDVGYKF